MIVPLTQNCVCYYQKQTFKMVKYPSILGSQLIESVVSIPPCVSHCPHVTLNMDYKYENTHISDSWGKK